MIYTLYKGLVHPCMYPSFKSKPDGLQNKAQEGCSHGPICDVIHLGMGLTAPVSPCFQCIYMYMYMNKSLNHNLLSCKQLSCLYMNEVTQCTRLVLCTSMFRSLLLPRNTLIYLRALWDSGSLVMPSLATLTIQ